MDRRTNLHPPPAVLPCTFPSTSLLGRDAAYFHDAYCVALDRADASATDLFFAVFRHRPGFDLAQSGIGSDGTKPLT
jgi:hypothetical protein